MRITFIWPRRRRARRKRNVANPSGSLSFALKQVTLSPAHLNDQKMCLRARRIIHVRWGPRVRTGEIFSGHDGGAVMRVTN